MHRLRAILIAGGVLALAAAGFTLPAPETATTAATAATTPDVASPATAESPATAAAPGVATAEPARAAGLETILGSASYYADMFEGRTTASGVPFRQAEMWAAHKTLPFGTILRVTNLENGNQVVVEVVDRGPYAHGRVLDLSKAAARKLDFIRAGHTDVRIEVL